jgi:hypothetical protein
VLRTLLLTCLLLTFATEAQSAHRIADACGLLTHNDKDLMVKCVNHAELFELNSEFIKAVADFDPSTEIRMRVLKSGASSDTLQLCKKLRWNLENTLSCLRSYPTPELLKSCKKLSSSEDDQLRCLRLGREAAQVSACDEISGKAWEKFACLERDVPALAVLNCRNQSEKANTRLRCLDEAVQAREEEYRRNQGSMKRDALAGIADPAYGDPDRVPSFPAKRAPAGVGH